MNNKMYVINKKFAAIAIILIGLVGGLFLSTPVHSFIQNLHPPQSCAEAATRHLHDIPKDSIYYSKKLDRDGDGYACE